MGRQDIRDGSGIQQVINKRGDHLSINIRPCEFDTIESTVKHHYQNLSSPIDSFLEEHILKSRHYQMLLDNTPIGHCSVFEGHLLTQFYLAKPYQHLGQQALALARRIDFLEDAFVPTCDEFMLSHVLEQQRKLEFQAYFFQDGRGEQQSPQPLVEITLTLATPADVELIKELSGDFFDNPKEQVEKEQLFIGRLRDQVVSFGIIEPGVILDKVASIGMFTVRDRRGEGFGRHTLLKLKEQCLSRGLTPISGCWYFNHKSRKTLEAAGMVSPTRLLKVTF